ncbi:MAG: deoxyribonuclease IV [Methanotrichaceae archaeon]|nr:deoxyribonuclease IV [Methanotrichaceae archaeon]
MRMGVHVSIAGSIDKAVDRALERGCDAFQIFSRNPRGWKVKEISLDVASAFASKLERSKMAPAVDHMPYLPNLASPREDIYERSVETLIGELDRCRLLGIPYLVTHLGSHLGQGREAGLQRIVSAISRAPDLCKTVILLETTAGTKNSIGGVFEDIGEILEALDRDDVGVCLDTCHIFAAGYEVRTEDGLENTMERFDDCIGLSKLKLIHLNDSKGGLGSRMDRHEHIGLGQIGEEGIRSILRHDAIRRCPAILETPVDERRDDRGNLEAARGLLPS